MHYTKCSLCLRPWRRYTVYLRLSIHLPTNTCPDALWRQCQIRSTTSSAFMNMYCLLAANIQKRERASFRTLSTLTQAHDFFQTCSEEADGSPILRLEKQLMGSDFHALFCLRVSRGLCRSFSLWRKDLNRKNRTKRSCSLTHRREQPASCSKHLATSTDESQVLTLKTFTEGHLLPTCVIWTK